MTQGPWFLEELSSMAEALSVKFSIINLDVGIPWNSVSEEMIQLLKTIIENQEEQLNLTISAIAFSNFKRDMPEKQKIFLTLVNKKCKEWTAKNLHLTLVGGWTARLDLYTPLLFKLDNIGHLKLLLLSDQLDEFKHVWMKTEKFTCYTRAGDLTTGGGRGDNPETDWQRFLDYLTTLGVDTTLGHLTT